MQEFAAHYGHWGLVVIMVVIASWILYRYAALQSWREWSGAGLVQARLDGVMQAEVSFEDKAATVHYHPQRVTPAQMIAAIQTIGFRASLWEPPAGQHLQGQGTVVAVDLHKGTVTLDHGEIKGLMPPMVMEFAVDAREALQGLKPGDTLTFTLRPRRVTFTITEITVLKQ